MAPALWFHSPLGGRVQKREMDSSHLSVQEKAVPQLPPQRQSLPVCHQCPSTYYPVTELRGGASEQVLVWVLQEELLGTPEASSTDSVPTQFFFFTLLPHSFLLPEVLEPWAG